MIILASAIIISLNNTGIINKANAAVDGTEMASEKQLIVMAKALAMGESKTGKITVEEMQKAMKDIASNGATTVLNNGNGMVIKFEENGSYYNIDLEGNIEDYILYVDTTPGELAKNSNGEYMIESIEDLVAFLAMTNGGYSDENINISSNKALKAVLMCDLDFKSPLSYGDSTTTIYNGYLGVKDDNVPLIDALTDISKYKGFIPIGNDSKIFVGTFDGNNHYIRNLCENTDIYSGLFGRVGNCTIKNINVTGNIKSSNYAGGIVGYVNKATPKIINCKNYSNISSELDAGGICGNISINKGTVIKNCSNYGKVLALNNSGGIIGYVYTVNIDSSIVVNNLCNFGNVTGTNAGGLVGYSIVRPHGICVINGFNGNKAIVNATNCAGEILGMVCSGIRESSFYNSLNLGNVRSENLAGGICGNTGDSTPTMINCYSSGNISGIYVGGLLGQRSWGGVIATGINCYYSLSDTVTNSIGKSGQSMNAIALEKLTEEEIKVMNNYIENDSDGLGTNEWKKWTLDGNGNPSFVN